METDFDLLLKYSREGSEDAFAEVVRRNVDLVFSVAFRKARSPQLAEEVTQSAFLDLAKNINRLRPGTVVSAWLYQVAHRTAVDAIRREMRRQAREHVAVSMSASDFNPDFAQPDWKQIEPILDDEMSALQEADRVAVLLRFFEGKSFSEVGRAIGLSDDAAQKRVCRALEKLRTGLRRRGVTVESGSLVALISTQAVQASPVGLVSSVVGALGSVTIASGGMAVAAAKTVAMAAVQKIGIALVAAGSLGVAAYQTQKCHRLERELAAIREHASANADVSAGGGADAAGAVARRDASNKSEDNSPEASQARLQAERDRLIEQRDAAERLSRLYKEVATHREAAGATHELPTPRHVKAAMGRLMRKSVLMQEALKGKKPEELSLEEQQAMQSGGVAMLGEVAALAEAELQWSRQTLEPRDPIDDLTVFAFGALDLQEEQFQQVYSLLRELQSDASALGGFGREPSGDEQEALKALNAGGAERLKALLTPEQQRLFQLLRPYMTLVRAQPAG